MTATNSTVANNVAGSGALGTFVGAGIGGDGGGIHSSGSADVLTDVTVAGNDAGLAGQSGGGMADPGSGGGVYRNGGSLVIRNSLLSANSGGSGSASNCGGDPVSDGGFNLAFPSAGCPAGFAVGDPVLGPLSSNGGPTDTMALGAGSAAVDAVPTSSCMSPSDQRGLPRPSGPACDIGAFEVQQTPSAAAPPQGSPLTGSTFNLTAALKKCKKLKNKKKRKKCIKRAKRRAASS